MSTGTLISVAEYLATSYRPDCDYVDGRVVERNLGEFDHSNLQTAIAAYLWANRKKWGIHVVVEQRIQVKPDRFRVPDICVVLGKPGEQIFTKPPFLCIEIVSPEDRMSRLQERVDDYLSMGVPYVWLIDPGTHRAFIATSGEGLREIKSGILTTETPRLEVPLSQLFE